MRSLGLARWRFDPRVVLLAPFPQGPACRDVGAPLLIGGDRGAVVPKPRLGDVVATLPGGRLTRLMFSAPDRSLVVVPGAVCRARSFHNGDPP